MENEERGSKAEFGIVCLKWELFLLFPFFIFHFQLLVPLCLRGRNNLRNTGSCAY